jgi:hypothetical protein
MASDNGTHLLLDQRQTALSRPAQRLSAEGSCSRNSFYLLASNVAFGHVRIPEDRNASVSEDDRAA